MKRAIIFTVIFAISLPLVLLLTNVEVTAFNSEFYEKKYEEYKIEEVTGINMTNLMYVTNEMLEYLKGNRDNLIIFTEVNGKVEQVFEEREILHMVDVKDLFSKGYIIRNTMAIILLIAFYFLLVYHKDFLGKAIIISSIWPMIFMGGLGILIYSDFYKYFTYFHEIFFDNDLWLLDPNTDILIQMLPLEFFSSIAYRILSIFAVELILLLVVGIILNRKKLKLKLSNL